MTIIIKINCLIGELKMSKSKVLFKSMKIFYVAIFSLSFLMLSANNSISREYPIGEPVELKGMEVAAVYIDTAVSQDDYWGAIPISEGPDIHLEADIHALRGNKNGFGAGEWIPYLTITYILKNLETGEEQEGLLWQMIASDGPHYGRNIKLKPGNYKLMFIIENPSKGGLAIHTDKATGVEPWWDNFTIEYSFKYEGATNGQQLRSSKSS